MYASPGGGLMRCGYRSRAQYRVLARTCRACSCRPIEIYRYAALVDSYPSCAPSILARTRKCKFVLMIQEAGPPEAERESESELLQTEISISDRSSTLATQTMLGLPSVVQRLRYVLKGRVQSLIERPLLCSLVSRMAFDRQRPNSRQREIGLAAKQEKV